MPGNNKNELLEIFTKDKHIKFLLEQNSLLVNLIINARLSMNCTNLRNFINIFLKRKSNKNIKKLFEDLAILLKSNPEKAKEYTWDISVIEKNEQENLKSIHDKIIKNIQYMV